MKQATLIFASLLAAFFQPLHAQQDVEAEKGEPKACDVGPLTKRFGYTDWLVYSCGDSETLAVVSAEGSPAMPFYFMIHMKDGKRRLFGEGTGDQEATAAAKQLRELIESDTSVAELIKETVIAANSQTDESK